MLTPLLSLRALFDRTLHAARESLHSTPTLDETVRSLRAQLGDLFARILLSMRLTTFSSLYASVARLFMKLARLCIEALDWLLLPRMAWKITVRHCLALLVLYFVKVLWNLALVPVIRGVYALLRPLFINAEYLSQEGVLQARMAAAKTFLEWKKAASELDRLQGKYHWKESSQSLHYDWRRIRDDLQRFRELVDSNDVRGIMAFSRSRLLRNLVGINDRRLYGHLRAGTKRLIEEYISEVVRALQLVCVTDSITTTTSIKLPPQAQGDGSGSGGGEGDSGGDDDDGEETDEYPIDPPTTAEKLSFFNETRHAFGRSALLLSGGATLGLYHIGVMKALHDSNLLPRVISGSSVGSIICAMVGTRTDEELHDLFDPEHNTIKLNFFPPNGGSVKRKFTRLFTQGVLMDIKILKKCVKANVPPLTFQEAYELSGRIINIVVSPASGSGNQDTLRLLNYLTAPNVLVWSAALASCAIPGIYAPVELMKKDEKTGKLSPYMEGGAPIKWEDGSVQADLPMQRLSELFNINHFIVSQCLLNGTRVKMADGTARCCELVKQGDELMGHRGEIVVAGPVQASMPRDAVWRIVHDDGSEYTVSSEHRVTIRCNASPQLAIVQLGPEQWRLQLSFMSAEVEWTRLTWAVTVGAEGLLAVEQCGVALEASESLPLLSEDGELLLLQAADDCSSCSTRNITSLHLTPSATSMDEQLRGLAISKLNELGRSAYLVRGQLAELSVVELYDRRAGLRWSSGADHIDRVTGFKAVLPLKMDAEQTLNSEPVAWSSRNDEQASDPANHCSTLIALGEGRYDAFVPNADSATIVYQLPTPLTSDAAHNASSSRAFILRRIEALQHTMGIAVHRGAGLIHTELKPASDLYEHCAQSIDHVLSLNTATIVAFGSFARDCWTAALRTRAVSGEFTNVSDSYERAVRRLRFTRWVADGSSSTCRELVTTVWLSPHPCDWHLGAVTSRAIALAHGCEPLQYVEAQSVLITSISKLTRTPSAAPFLVTNISIDAKKEQDKRYVLDNGIITHNCNPHVVPFISSASSTHTLQQSFLMSPLSKLLDYLLSQLKSTALNFLHLNIIPIHPSVKYVLDQKYLGDITLVPDVTPFDYTQLLVNPTAERLSACIIQSENSTWRLIPTIRGACEIEFSLDECVRRMRGTLILEELSDVRRFSRHMSRVRSWSSDLLAVGQHASHAIPGGDSHLDAPCEPCAPNETRQLSSRTRSEHNLLGPALQRAQTEHMSAAHVAALGKWNNRFERLPSVKRSATAFVPSGSMAARHPRLGAARRTSARDVEHEAEDDDIVSEEEEQEALRRQQELWRVKVRSDSDPDGDQADEDQRSQHEGQIDDEGITRQRMPMHSPEAEGRPTPIAQPPAEVPPAAAAAEPQKDTLIAAAGPASAVPQLSPERPTRVPALRSGRKGSVPAKRVNIFSPVDPEPSPAAAAAATATPEWSGAAPVTPVEPIVLPAPSLFTPPPPAPTSSDGLGVAIPTVTVSSEAAAARLQTPQSGSFASLPPMPRRRGDNDRAVSAAVGPSAGGMRAVPRSTSRPRTPDPVSSSADPTLSRQEWQEEKHNPLLSQLLKTTQTRVSVASPSSYKRNASANRQSALGGASGAGGAGSSDVSLHIPSLVMFRPTPPRRMSAMDLKLLDDGAGDDAGAAMAAGARPMPRTASHHHHTFHAPQRPLHQTHHESSDSEEELAQQQASSSRRASVAPETGSLSMWLTRASSFFGGTPSSAQAAAADASFPTRGRAASAASTGSVEPLSESDDDAFATHTPASPPQHARYPPRAAMMQQQQLPASSSPFAPRSQTQPLNAAAAAAAGSERRGSSGSPRIRAAASPAAGYRYAGASSSATPAASSSSSASSSGPHGIAAAVRSGLPRTLSQLELISDVSTMP